MIADLHCRVGKTRTVLPAVVFALAITCAVLSGGVVDADAEEPGSPYDVVAMNGDESIDVTWKPDPRGLILTANTIKCNFVDGVPSLTRHAPGGDTRSYTMTGLENGKLYKCIIESVAGGARSVPSKEFMGRPFGTPSSPINVKVTPGFEELFVSWDWNNKTHGNGRNIQYYHITYTVDSNEETLKSKINSVTITGLTPDETYAVKVNATNKGGLTSPYSSTVRAAPNDGTTPGKPQKCVGDTTRPFNCCILGSA